MNRVKGRTATIVAGAFLAAMLIVVPSAQAAVTMSTVSAPKSGSYFVFNADSPNTFAVSGTTDGSPGDLVDLLCYYGSSSKTLATDIPVGTGGAFSAAKVPWHAARMAVPAARDSERTVPGDLTPFAGPTLMLGETRHTTYSSGPNSGKLYDYYATFQQPGGAFDYDSVPSCGVCDGYLAGPNMQPGAVTFWSNAALFYLLPGDGPEQRSEVQVDGANAYPPTSVHEINAAAAGVPKLTYSYTENTKNGDTVIHETDQIAKCADPTYPPTAGSCATFKPTGITDTVTITQDHGGRIAWVSDVFSSTDGKKHKLDLDWDNNQRFYAALPGDATQIEYEFPGQSSYSMHAVSDIVNPKPGPGTIFIRVHGAADGDTSTGRGAIVYDRTSNWAEFRRAENYDEAFTLHQTATVPAHGSARFRFAYVQGYESAQVASLARYAATVFKGTSVPRVVGKSLAPAKKALRRAHCTAGKIRHVRSATVPAGHVGPEKPKAKTHVDYGTKVSLVVSTG